MDPLTLSVLLGVLTNGLYSLILSTGDKVGGLVGDFVFRKEDIHEYLMKYEKSYSLIVEEALQDTPSKIEPEEFCGFLKSNGIIDIITKIYSFCLSDYENLNNLDDIKKDFCEQLVIYFSQKEEISTYAPQFFLFFSNAARYLLILELKKNKIFQHSITKSDLTSSF